MILSGHNHITYKDRFMVAGVKAGRFNQPEFIHLNQIRNDITACHKELSQDGISKEDQQILNQKEHKFDRLAESYFRRESQPEVDSEPQTEKLYQGLAKGDVTSTEGHTYLDEERWMSKQRSDDSEAGQRQIAHAAYLEWATLNNDWEFVAR